MLAAGLLVLVALGWYWQLAGAPLDERGAADRGTDPERMARALAGLGYLVDPADVLLPDPASRAGFGPLAWRPLLFATDPSGGGGSDIHRGEIRFDAAGRLLDLRRVVDLTRTSSARERLLGNVGPVSLWSVGVDGAVQSLLLVDLRRDDREFDAGAGAVQHLLAAATDRLQTGQWSGVGLDSYDLLVPALRVERGAPATVPGRLNVLLYRDGDTIDGRLSFDLLRKELTEGAGEVSHRPRLWGGTPVVHWLVDTVRGFSWVGTRPIALLEKWVFNAENALEELAYRLGLVAEERVADELGLAGATTLAPGQIKLATAGSAADADWPPPALQPLVPGAQEGEGQWFPFDAPWLKKLPGAPPAFYKTALRLPGKPPYLVVLVAMDLRQLELAMVAGMGTPWSSTGNQGPGRIPRDPERLGRTVAAFNGGFQTAHGAFGMMVDGTVVLEPWQKTATLAVRRDGTVAMGTWNNSLEIPPDLRSFRQNMPPLLEDGVWNPMRQSYWGGTVSDLDQVNTTRSAVGYRGRYQLIYAWSLRVSAKSIAEALLAAGCEYGMHLDMNPAHAGFGLLDLDPAQLNKHGTLASFKSQAANRAQSFDFDRFANRNGKDFFYLMLRRTLPQQLPTPPAGFAAWEGRSQPDAAEAFLPPLALSRKLDGQELLAALDLRRLRTAYLPGSSVAAMLPPEAPPLAPCEATLRQPVCLLDLGGTDHHQALGVVTGGRTVSPLLGGAATLAVDGEGRLQLLGPAKTTAGTGAPPEQHQGCPLLVEGRLSPKGVAQLGRSAPGARHHVLGLGPDGLLYYLASPLGATDLAARLGGLGVEEALLLPDGEGSRLQLLSASAGGLLLEEPVSGARTPLSAYPDWGSRLLFDLLPTPVRVDRLRLPEVVLSAEEQQRQDRIQNRIKEKRAVLRKISNFAYQQYIEKVREGREAKEGQEGQTLGEAGAPPGSAAEAGGGAAVP